MARYGYIRKKKPNEIMIQLNTIMIYECDEVYIEEVLFSRNSELTRLMSKIKHGDTLIVESISSFGKNVKDLNEMLVVFSEKNIHLISCKDEIDSEELQSFYNLSALLFKINKETASQARKHRHASVSKKGVHHGRPPVNDKTIKKIRYLSEAKNMTMRLIAEKCDVALGTVYKYLNNETVFNEDKKNNK